MIAGFDRHRYPTGAGFSYGQYTLNTYNRPKYKSYNYGHTPTDQCVAAAEDVEIRLLLNHPLERVTPASSVYTFIGTTVSPLIRHDSAQFADDQPVGGPTPLLTCSLTEGLSSSIEPNKPVSVANTVGRGLMGLYVSDAWQPASLRTLYTTPYTTQESNDDAVPYFTDYNAPWPIHSTRKFQSDFAIPGPLDRAESGTFSTATPQALTDSYMWQEDSNYASPVSSPTADYRGGTITIEPNGRYTDTDIGGRDAGDSGCCFENSVFKRW